MKYFQLFRITGTANSIAYDDGLKSTQAEPKRLIAIHAQVDSYSRSDDNNVQGWHERAKVFEFPETLLPTQHDSDGAETTPVANSLKIPVDIDLPPGETFKAAIQCAATAKVFRGVYEYEII